MIKEEITKLLDIKFVSEVIYPNWLANVGLVKKANRKWKVCIDFIDLNKDFLKDNYPLPCIDHLVDFTAGHELLSFLDAYLGCHQIFMVDKDKEKTSFITNQGIYCYNMMSFGLKNVGFNVLKDDQQSIFQTNRS